MALFHQIQFSGDTVLVSLHVHIISDYTQLRSIVERLQTDVSLESTSKNALDEAKASSPRRSAWRR